MAAFYWNEGTGDLVVHLTGVETPMPIKLNARLRCKLMLQRVDFDRIIAASVPTGNRPWFRICSLFKASSRLYGYCTAPSYFPPLSVPPLHPSFFPPRLVRPSCQHFCSLCSPFRHLTARQSSRRNKCSARPVSALPPTPPSTCPHPHSMRASCLRFLVLLCADQTRLRTRTAR